MLRACWAESEGRGLAHSTCYCAFGSILLLSPVTNPWAGPWHCFWGVTCDLMETFQ